MQILKVDKKELFETDLVFTFLVPEGNLTLVLLVSGLWAMTVA